MKKFHALILRLMTVPSSCLAFSPTHSHQPNAKGTRVKVNGISSLSSSSSSDVILDVAQWKQSKIELWLDLRQTSISPRMALGHIASMYDEISDKFGAVGNDESSSSSWRVDKVLTKQRHDVGNMVNDMRQNMSMQYTSHQHQRDIGMMIMDYEQHYEKNGKYEYTAIHELSDSGILLPRGRVINVEIGGGRDGITKLNADPMPVIEPVSRGDWVVLDVHNDAYGFGFDHGYDVEKLSSINDISSLVEVVSDGVGAFGTIEGDVNVNLALNTNTNTSSGSRGGIGLSCPTQTSLLEMSALLSTLNQNRKRYEMTDSGIITQQYSNQQQEQQLKRQQQQHENENTSSYVVREGTATTYAIVMPFDEELWKTSSFFLLQ